MSKISSVVYSESNWPVISSMIESAIDKAMPMFMTFQWCWATDRGLVVPNREEMRAMIEELLESCVNYMDHNGGSKAQSASGRFCVRVHTDSCLDISVALDIGSAFLELGTDDD